MRDEGCEEEGDREKRGMRGGGDEERRGDREKRGFLEI